MRKNIALTLLIGLVCLTFVSAADFNIKSSGDKIFTVSSTGNVNATGTINATAYYDDGVLLSDIYLALAGGVLTGVVTSDSNITTTAYIKGNFEDNMMDIAGENITSGTIGFEYLPTLTNLVSSDYHNITNIPSCDGTYESLSFDGTDLSCINITVADNSINIDAANITSGTIAYARLPTFVNMTTLSYHNITDFPECAAGEVLKFNSTGLFCVTDDTGATDFTNVAWINETNTFAEEQVFSKMLNVTEGIRLMSNTSVITRADVPTTNISIDSAGNVNIELG